MVLQGAPNNLRLSIPYCRIFDSSVEAGITSMVAAPFAPATLQLDLTRAPSKRRLRRQIV